MSAHRWKSPLDRFWKWIEKTGGCWKWRGHLAGSMGYGSFWSGYAEVRAHRFSWEIHNGPIPNGMFVCHKCDTPSCVNPQHLFLGTQKDNMRDCANKRRDRRPIGSENHFAKLTEEEVLEIRKIGKAMGPKELAKKYNCCARNIGHILRGDTWTHIKEG